MSTFPYICSSVKFSHKDIVYASNEREAAEKFAGILYRFYDEKFCVIDIEVKEANNHYCDTTFYTVDVKIEPVFNAYKTGGMGVLNVEP